MCLFREGVAATIHDFDPNAKALVCLRDPNSRAFSHWSMFRQIFETNFDETWSGYMDDVERAEREALWSPFHRERFPRFEEAIKDDIKSFYSSSKCSEPSLVRRGTYEPQVRTDLDQFGPANVMVIGSSDLREFITATLGSIIQFLGSGPFSFNTNDLQPVHVRAYELALSTRRRHVVDTLTKPYRPLNAQLEELFVGLPNW